MQRVNIVWTIVLVAVGTGAFFAGRLSIPERSAFARIDVHCAGGFNFSVSTGNNHGSCKVEHDRNGEPSSASCDDGHGNSASADCKAGGSCNQSQGAGSCSIQK